MEMTQLEFIATKFIELCQKNPDICPHDYHWSENVKVEGTDLTRVYYKCSICGRKKYELVEQEEMEVK